MPPRYLPSRSLPPYSYVTGRYPHPTRDPQGHSFAHESGTPRPLDPVRWQQSEDFLFAIDLFNHGYYWEAHEAWEGLWLAAGRSGSEADFLKALIKLAAAGVKAREGRQEGVRRHARRAIELLERLLRQPLGPSYAGLNLHELAEHAKNVENQPPLRPAVAEPVEVVFDFWLRLQL